MFTFQSLNDTLIKEKFKQAPPLMCTDKLVGLYVCVEIWKLLKFNSSNETLHNDTPSPRQYIQISIFIYLS